MSQLKLKNQEVIDRYQNLRELELSQPSKNMWFERLQKKQSIRESIISICFTWDDIYEYKYERYQWSPGNENDPYV